LIEQAPADGGLSGADLARHHDKSAAVLDAEQEMGEGLFVFLAEKEETGVGREVERLFRQAIKRLVHARDTPCMLQVNS
jgi:hypothetical protein